MGDVAETYRSKLTGLRSCSKRLIYDLTMLAEEFEQKAPEIVKVIYAQIWKVPTNQKLPLLYLIDSMIRNLTSSSYPQLFIQNIIPVFCHIFEQADKETRSAMYELRIAWTDERRGIPTNALFALDILVKKIDQEWPITAKPPGLVRQPKLEPEDEMPQVHTLQDRYGKVASSSTPDFYSLPSLHKTDSNLLLSPRASTQPQDPSLAQNLVSNLARRNQATACQQTFPTPPPAETSLPYPCEESYTAAPPAQILSTSASPAPPVGSSSVAPVPESNVHSATDWYSNVNKPCEQTPGPSQYTLFLSEPTLATEPAKEDTESAKEQQKKEEFKQSQKKEVQVQKMAAPCNDSVRNIESTPPSEKNQHAANRKKRKRAVARKENKATETLNTTASSKEQEGSGEKSSQSSGKEKSSLSTHCIVYSRTLSSCSSPEVCEMKKLHFSSEHSHSSLEHDFAEEENYNNCSSRERRDCWQWDLHRTMEMDLDYKVPARGFGSRGSLGQSYQPGPAGYYQSSRIDYRKLTADYSEKGLPDSFHQQVRGPLPRNSNYYGPPEKYAAEEYDDYGRRDEPEALWKPGQFRGSQRDFPQKLHRNSDDYDPKDYSSYEHYYATSDCYRERGPPRNFAESVVKAEDPVAKLCADQFIKTEPEDIVFQEESKEDTSKMISRGVIQTVPVTGGSEAPTDAPSQIGSGPFPAAVPQDEPWMSPQGQPGMQPQCQVDLSMQEMDNQTMCEQMIDPMALAMYAGMDMMNMMFIPFTMPQIFPGGINNPLVMQSLQTVMALQMIGHAQDITDWNPQAMQQTAGHPAIQQPFSAMTIHDSPAVPTQPAQLIPTANTASSATLVPKPALAPVDIDSLLSKLKASGIIGQPAQKKEEAPGKFAMAMLKEEPPTLEQPPDLSDFETTKLKKQYSAVVDSLYCGIQCPICHRRFVMEDMEQCRQHLNRHTRQKTESTQSTSHDKWFYKLMDWMEVHEMDGSEEGTLEEEIAATPESVQYEALQDREENVCNPPSSDNETGDDQIQEMNVSKGRHKDNLEQWVAECLLNGKVPRQYDDMRRPADASQSSVRKTYLSDHLKIKSQCWKCDYFKKEQQRGTLPREEKTAVGIHVTTFQEKTQKYSCVIAKAKEAAQNKELTALEKPETITRPCSRDFFSHYSFDFAQELCYPRSLGGPVSAKTSKKCKIFGIVAEALPQMAMFLLGEKVQKREISEVNAIISMLHFFFERYGLGETECHLHADNCARENKNNALLQYLAWRVWTGHHEVITLSFLLTGHTKFGPDWCYGLFKQHALDCRVDCLEDIAKAARDASPTLNILIPHIVNDQTGRQGIPLRDWAKFLGQRFNKLGGLKSFHQFQFEMVCDKKEKQLQVHCKEAADGMVCRQYPLKNTSYDHYQLPDIIPLSDVAASGSGTMQ